MKKLFLLSLGALLMTMPATLARLRQGFPF
jgi:hypothetical protein